jgi:hypothetical protein
MKRFLPGLVTIATAPLALGGCYAEAWGERASPARATPPADVITAPGFAQLARTWSLPPGNPWAPYIKYTLLTYLGSGESNWLPDPDALPEVHRARSAAARLSRAGLPADTLWVVDMNGAASVAFGAALSQFAAEDGIAVAPIITFNNWPDEYELVPAEYTLAALARFSPSMPPAAGDPGRPVFLLDSWRLAHRDETPADDVTDNRYMLGPADLPDAATLRERGIRRVVYVVEDSNKTPHEEDDLNPSFAAWGDAGIELSMMDLADLERLPIDEPRVYPWGFGRTFVVVPRPTLIHDPRFWARAHGGFGGVHAAPWVTGGHWYGGSIGGG